MSFYFVPIVVAALVSAPPQQGDFLQCTRVLRTFQGQAPGDQFGWVSAPVSDVNGDGIAELAVGAPGHGSGGVGAGRAYLYDVATGVRLFFADGGAAGERLGHAVREAGDLDGDGTEDWLAGGPGSATVAGAARIYSGFDGALLATLRSGSVGDNFGYSVAGLGDVNGDLVPDHAVGAPLADFAGVDSGRAFVLSGADGVTVLHVFDGESAADNFGTAVARLGDVNGDGLPELAVGAANAGTGGGRAYVFDLATDALLYPPLLPDASAAEFGQFFVDDAGLVGSDAVPDLYVGDFADGGGRGKAYLFDGATGARLRTFTGLTGEGFGIGRGVGDVNADGRDDIVLGAWTSSQGANGAGKLEVYSGANGALLRRITSTTAGENLGFDAHGIGDVDGDGVPDLVGTAATFGGSRGRVYVLADRPLEAIGLGLAGSGGLVPALTIGGCPRVGDNITLDTSSVVGGGLGLLLISARRVDHPVRGGVLHPARPYLFRVAHMASGTTGTPGVGTSTHAFTLPNDPALVGVPFWAQARYMDPGAVQGTSFTRGLRITIY